MRKVYHRISLSSNIVIDPLTPEREFWRPVFPGSRLHMPANSQQWTQYF